MATGSDFSDWMSVSGGRRQPCKRAPRSAGVGVRPVVADGLSVAEEPQAAPSKRLASRGPIDWVEFMRGLTLLGILCGTVWVEWVAIKSLAVYCSRFFAG